MRDDEKPRRARDEELAELLAPEAEKHRDAEKQWGRIPPAVDPALPLAEAVTQMDADEEAALAARERAETREEQEESTKILAVEASMRAEIPRLRARELRRTFGKSYAAAAVE